MTEVKEDSTSTTNDSDSNAIAGVAERLYFFFSDANLRQDKFLRTELQNNPYVSLKTLLKFNSIKNFTTDSSILIKAAKEEKCKSKLKLNDSETGIGRITPFTKDLMGKHVELTVRVSNLPTSGDVQKNAVYDVTIDEVKSLFVEYGEVAMVRLLHNYIKPKGKTAYGRAFVEFESMEAMNKAVADLCVKDIANKDEKPKKSLKIKDTDLRVKTMQQWLDKKAKDKEEYLKSKGKNGGKKQNDKKQNDKKREREEKEEEALDVPEFKLDWKSGCIIKLTKLPKGCDREQILKAVYEVFDKDVGVRADYSRGQEDGCIRFDEVSPKIGELCTKLSDGSITIGESAVGSAAILEGEPEKEYYKNFIAFMSKNMRMRAEEKRNKQKRQKRD